jgi:hypothetical protein
MDMCTCFVVDEGKKEMNWFCAMTEMDMGVVRCGSCPSVLTTKSVRMSNGTSATLVSVQHNVTNDDGLVDDDMGSEEDVPEDSPAVDAVTKDDVSPASNQRSSSSLSAGVSTGIMLLVTAYATAALADACSI